MNHDISVQPAAGYIGGKRRLSRAVIRRIEAVPHRRYIEPFVGMGGIFLRRRQAAPVEVINDLNGDVANFFRVLQEHYPYFIDLLRFRVASRAEFERLKELPPERLTDLNRAARFLYLQRLAFGGKVAGRHFGVSPAHSARFNITKLEPMLSEIHERLAGVVIERLDFRELIARYDHPDALFYLDPPYFGSEGDYGADLFDRAAFEDLAALLTGLRGKFLLSINDTPEIRACFSGFDLEPVLTRYCVGGGNHQCEARELIFSN